MSQSEENLRNDSVTSKAHEGTNCKEEIERMERTAAPRKAPLDIAGGRAVLSMLIDKHSFTGFDPVSSWNGAASSISMLEIATLSGSQFPAKTPRKLLERVRSALTMGPYVFRRP